jgi:hypothetical protein
MALHNRHDFHALSALRSSDFRSAALGHDGMLRSMKHSSSFRAPKLVGNLRQHAMQNLIAAPSLKAPITVL